VQVAVQQGGSTLQTVDATLEAPGQLVSAWSAEIALSNGEGDYTLAASAGRGGSLGSPQRITISYDVADPNLAVTTPASDGGTVTQAFNLAGTVDDSGSGIASVEVSFDDGCTWLPASVAGTAWSLDWTPPDNQENVGYSFLVRAQDNAANGTRIARSVVVDNTPPTGLDPVAFNVAEESYLDNVGATLTFTWTKAVDASGVADVLVSVNQEPDGSATGTPTNAASRTHRAELNSGGDWYVHLAAEDALGNRFDRTYGPWYVGEQGAACTNWVQVIDLHHLGRRRLLPGLAGRAVEARWLACGLLLYRWRRHHRAAARLPLQRAAIRGRSRPGYLRARERRWHALGLHGRRVAAGHHHRLGLCPRQQRRRRHRSAPALGHAAGQR
jgi:hypothetical protein